MTLPFLATLPPQALDVATAVLTGLAVATLVPTVDAFVKWPLKTCIWALFVAVWALRVATVSDAEVNQATAAVAWAATQVVAGQASLAQHWIAGWVVDHRFEIATSVVLVVGADMLALALVRSHRIARLSVSRVHLGEWFEMPTRHAAVVGDPVSELNRRLAARTQGSLRTLARSAAVRAVFVKPFAHAAAHVLGPGPERLRMVKLAWGIERPAATVEPDPSNTPRSRPTGRRARARRRIAPVIELKSARPGKDRLAS